MGWHQKLPRKIPVVSYCRKTSDIQDGGALGGAGCGGLIGVVRHRRSLVGQHARAGHPPQLGTLPGLLGAERHTDTESHHRQSQASGKDVKSLTWGLCSQAETTVKDIFHIIHKLNSNFHCCQSQAALRMKHTELLNQTLQIIYILRMYFFHILSIFWANYWVEVQSKLH